MMRVGIPRALLYYQYYPAWKTFFEEMGAEVVVSPPTTTSAPISNTIKIEKRQPYQNLEIRGLLGYNENYCVLSSRRKWL